MCIGEPRYTRRQQVTINQLHTPMNAASEMISTAPPLRFAGGAPKQQIQNDIDTVKH
ncbi:UNVERIFIED_CONTAM: hypothetical protein FKN15_012353 [Acipenser sinensis]